MEKKPDAQFARIDDNLRPPVPPVYASLPPVPEHMPLHDPGEVPLEPLSQSRDRLKQRAEDRPDPLLFCLG